MMTALEEMRTTLRALVRAVSAAPPEPLPQDQLVPLLILCATIGRALNQDYLARRLADLRVELIEEEAERERGLLPVVGDDANRP